VRRIFRKRPANSTDTIVTDRRRPAVYSASTAVSFTTSICYDDQQGPRPDTAVCRSSPWWTRLHTWTAVRRDVAIRQTSNSMYRMVKQPMLCTQKCCRRNTNWYVVVYNWLHCTVCHYLRILCRATIAQSAIVARNFYYVMWCDMIWTESLTSEEIHWFLAYGTCTQCIDFAVRSRRHRNHRSITGVSFLTPWYTTDRPVVSAKCEVHRVRDYEYARNQCTSSLMELVA